jgi:hypothetical protein
LVLNKKETKPLDPARDANRGIFIHNEPQIVTWSCSCSVIET